MSIIHSSKDYLDSAVCWRRCQQYLSVGIASNTPHVAITGFIHPVPTTAGFLSNGEPSTRIGTGAPRRQASAFSIALKLPGPRLPAISQFPTCWAPGSSLLQSTSFDQLKLKPTDGWALVVVSPVRHTGTGISFSSREQNSIGSLAPNGALSPTLFPLRTLTLSHSPFRSHSSFSLLI